MMSSRSGRVSEILIPIKLKNVRILERVPGEV